MSKIFWRISSWYSLILRSASISWVGQGSLGIHGEDQHAISLLGQVVGRCRGEGGLAQTSFSSKHDVPSVGVFGENVGE